MSGPFSAGPVSGSRAPAFPEGHVVGLQVAQASATTATVAPGSCRDDGDAVNIRVPSQLTVDITTSGALGLDTGAEAASTLYHVWVISGASGVSAILSASETSPTLPAGYTHKRLVGWVMNGSSSSLSASFTAGAGRDRRTVIDYDATDQSVLVSGGATSGTVDLSGVVPLAATEVRLRAIYDPNGTATHLGGVGPAGHDVRLLRVVSDVEQRQIYDVALDGTASIDWSVSHTLNSLTLIIESFRGAI